MAEVDMAGAIRDTLAAEMRRDDRVTVLGHGVGRLGGTFAATRDLLDEFGDGRVLDMPLGENGLIGAAVGMALYGLRPVAEIQFADFAYPAFEQLFSEMAKYRYRSAGQYTCPVIVRVPYGGGVRGGHYQSQSPEAHFAHTAGLVVASPSTPLDAVGLIRSAIRGNDPVVLFEPKALYGSTAQAPDDDFTVPFGVAKQLREGGDVTVVSYGAMVHTASLAAARAEQLGIEVDLLDLRTLVPFDIGAVLGSVAKTGRAVLVQEAPRSHGYMAEIAAVLAEKAVFHLQAPVLRASGFDTPFPYALETSYMPGKDRVLAEIVRAANY